jgi:RNA polymerase sigma-70 factor (ECF subfamily)
MIATLPRVNYRDDPDVVLMLRVQRGDTAAFAELVRTYQDRVFARLLRAVGDRQLAEDLTQDVFLRLYRCRKRYEPRARLSTWIYHISGNVVRNALRTRRRHAWLHFAPLEQTEGRFPERFADAAATDPVERSETAGRVRDALSALMARQRRALELQHYDDRSYPEIASDLSLTQKAAKSLLYRARVELRRLLTSDTALIP